MTPRFVLSNLLKTLLKLWGVDAAAALERRDSSLDEFARAAARRSYIRGRTKVSVSARSPTAPE